MKTVLFAAQGATCLANGRVPVRNGLVEESTFYPDCKNLARFSQRLGNSTWWGKITGVITPNYATAPDGTQTASRWVSTDADDSLYQLIPVTAGESYVLSWWVKNNGGSDYLYSLAYDQTQLATINALEYAPSSSWVRLQIQFVVPTGCTNVWIQPMYNLGVSIDMLIWGVQLEKVLTTTPTKNLVRSSVDFKVYGYGNESHMYLQNNALWGDRTAMRTTLTEIDSQIYYSLEGDPIAPGTYTFSWYHKRYGASCPTIYCYVYDATHSTTLVDNGYTPQGTWGRMEMTFTVPAGCLQAIISFCYCTTETDVDVYFKSTQLERNTYATSFECVPNLGNATDYVETYERLLLDSSRPRKNLFTFETATNDQNQNMAEGWFPCSGNETLTWDATHYEGEYSKKCVNGVLLSYGVYSAYMPTVKPLTTYTFSCWVKVTAGTGVACNVEEYTDNTGYVKNNWVGDNIFSASSEWVRIWITFTTAATTGRISAVITGESPFTFYADGAQLEEGSTPSGHEISRVGYRGWYWNPDTSYPTFTNQGMKFVTNDYAQFPNRNVIRFGTGDFTVIVVAKSNDYSPANHQVFCNTMGSVGWAEKQFFVSVQESHFTPSILDTGVACYCYHPTELVNGRFYVFTLRRKGAEACAFLNKSKYTSSTNVAAANITPDFGLYLGSFGGGDGFLNGTISGVYIYNRALSDSEIERNYKALKTYMNNNRGTNIT